MTNEQPAGSMLARVWRTLRRPSAKYSLLTMLLIGAAGGIIFWGGFNTAMEATNTMEFCISCHEMRDNVYKEYQQTIHYENRTGVRAICSDCHVPRAWLPKVKRKIQATNELWHKMLGSVDTPEKFDAKRLELAQHEWDRLKKNDSLECRNCHSFQGMKVSVQKERAKKFHELAQKKGETCIDCHKGIAHKPVHKELEAAEEEETL
jgi:cytochrome c-type protein NapC